MWQKRWRSKVLHLFWTHSLKLCPALRLALSEWPWCYWCPVINDVRQCPRCSPSGSIYGHARHVSVCIRHVSYMENDQTTNAHISCSLYALLCFRLQLHWIPVCTVCVWQNQYVLCKADPCNLLSLFHASTKFGTLHHFCEMPPPLFFYCLVHFCAA